MTFWKLMCFLKSFNLPANHFLIHKLDERNTSRVYLLASKPWRAQIRQCLSRCRRTTGWHLPWDPSSAKLPPDHRPEHSIPSASELGTPVWPGTSWPKRTWLLAEISMVKIFYPKVLSICCFTVFTFVRVAAVCNDTEDEAVDFLDWTVGEDRRKLSWWQ